MADVVPDGYEPQTYWHLNHAACPQTGDESPLTLYVPIDKTGWTGAICGACGQQLQSF